jgi:hypothetical protein
MVDPTFHKKWLEEDIPHRVRASVARTPLLEELLGRRIPDRPLETRDETIARRCETDSIWEGRLAATRWLIDFVGVKVDTGGDPAERKKSPKHPHDVRIDDLPNGRIIDAASSEGAALAKVWQGCSQGSSHATHESGHPSVEVAELNRALRIIVAHLDKTVYRDKPRKILDLALQPSG